MTVLFDSVVPILGGVNESALMAVPGGIKQPGIPLTLLLSVENTLMPVGTSTLTIFLSSDGGATFRSASSSGSPPTVRRGVGPHFWQMGYSLGANDVITHVKFSTNVPSTFVAQVKLEAT